MVVDAEGYIWEIVSYNPLTNQYTINLRIMDGADGPPLWWGCACPVFPSDTFVCPD